MNDNNNKQIEDAEAQTWQWLDKAVIGLNLCPFAKKPRANNQIKLVISQADNSNDLTNDLLAELDFLTNTPAEQTDTTVIVIPNFLTDFTDYLHVLDVADMLIDQMGYRGTFQLASFHPNYQFDGTEPNDAENLTNTAPFPMLHLIREDSMEKVLTKYPDPESIPVNNIKTVESLSEEQMGEIYSFKRSGKP
ncbi:hypothetical protein GCM10008107_10420 [Psychrosphaera saromensis]|uniref:Peptidase n=1 Tax=Psychrosphaera saromensis TaxID=716813 RepID=A0A2S7UUR7_9GAMM|nr:DUF1415 domain-containing protein [Psychrosphaera saromensis]PQJ53683.1 hypothetical protein BTO11_08380 [Psychrosphaera saromensis]GHB63239.1 hypothetical protein GCM10008107_10420 [Psychrosphaera saromensis]GLQ15545.1 hypothetical protein GCM10007917_30000 [Psychrosphaera saromensis]